MTNWQTKKLGDIGTFTKGAGIPKDFAQSGDLPAVRYGELYTLFDVFIRKPNSHVSRAIANASVKIKKGDILFAGSGETIDEIGKSAVYQLDEDGYAGGDIVILRPDSQQDPSFLGHALNSEFTRKQLRRFGQGQSVVHIYRKDLESLEISLPEKPEQERIVGVLGVWDEYIEKLEQKIALKEQLKKGLMQQLLTGKRRLPGFNNKWQVSSIGEVSEFINGYTFLSSSYVNDGKYKIVTIANVQDGRMDSGSAKTIMELPKNINDQQILKVGDIIISMTGNVGRTCRVDIENGLLNQRVGKIVANKTVRSDYLYYLLQSRHFLAKMIERAQGGAQDNLSAKDIKKYRIVVPTYDEQTAIANVLCSADFTISGLKSKKDVIVKQKQYLLKNLITGTIRTPETLTPKGANS